VFIAAMAMLVLNAVMNMLVLVAFG